MRGKLIVIEGTDCSGKETQSKKLYQRLNDSGYKIHMLGFPMYDTPTGKIVGGPYLGKSYICEGWFPEKAPNVDAKVSCLLYAADRAYNVNKILTHLDNGENVILDRYTYSAMAHQGGKMSDISDRKDMYKFVETLEFDLLKLPIPDIKIFLHMPLEAAMILKDGREEAADQNEADANHLINAEKAFLEVAELYDFKTIECASGYPITKESIRTIDDVSDEIYNYVLGKL